MIRFDFKEWIFNAVMLSETDWIIRTHNKIIDVQSGAVSNMIETGDFPGVMDAPRLPIGSQLLHFQKNTCARALLCSV